MKLIRGKMMIQNAMLKSKVIVHPITANHFLGRGVVSAPLVL